METTLRDPMTDDCKAVRKDALVRGQSLAGELFENDMAEVMGMVFGDMFTNAVMSSVGASLFDVSPLVYFKDVKVGASMSVEYPPYDYLE